MQYLDGKTTVTHIIAASLTPKKAIEFRRYRIVKPAWVVDSVAAGKLLPWERYRVLDEGVKQGLIGFDDGKVVSQANTSKRSYREQTNTSWYTSQVKQVAEDIDDEEGAHFPSTQTVIMNGYMQSSSAPRSADRSSKVNNLPTSTPASSHDESIELTSSLEDVLDQAAISIQADHPQKDSKVSQSTDYSALEEGPSVEVSEDEPALKAVLPQAEPHHSLERHPDGTEGQLTSHMAQPSQGDKAADEQRPDGKRPSQSTKADFHMASPSKVIVPMTAEEHNAALIADPHVWKSTTANPDFLKQYYAESRLHHLSAWKADLKAKMQAMAAQRSSSQVQRTKRQPGSRRYIMHVDFDSFFCAVSLKSAPGFADKPCVVAHGSGPGSEIASCNYPARAFGVKNGMWMKHALNLCKNIKVLPYDYPAYEEASREFYEAILDVGGIVQSVSIDEALVDVSAIVLPAGGTDGHGVQEGSIWREQEKADEVATSLRAKIKERTGCAVSIGIGGNILLAKVALRKAKPAGQHQIKPDDVLDFIGELTLPDLPGVAYSIAGKLEEIGVTYVKDARALSKERLTTILGPKTGEKIFEYARGIDKAEVGDQVIRKSVSAEVNWGIRFINQIEAEEFVQKMCFELSKRLLEAGVKGRQLTMKIMRRAADAPLDPPKNLGHGKCDTFNKSVVLGVTTTSAEIIGKEAVSILRSYGFSPGELRGLGVQMQKLEPLKAHGIEASQKRISFGAPTKQNVPPHKTARATSEDPIDDSPVKPKSKVIHPAMVIVKANEAHGHAAKPLNIMGTQFVLPTQIDPSVLAELPVDIRSKLMSQSRQGASGVDSPAARSRSPSPAKYDPLQLPSQLDQEVFDALPEDMKAEVLATYPARALKGQTVLPQSPRKTRTIVLSKKQITPTKPRIRGRPPGHKNRPRTMESSTGLMQSNFLTEKLHAAKASATDSEGPSDAELDLEFLAALPEDVRAEIISEHKKTRLARRSGLVAPVQTSHRRRQVVDAQILRKIELPPRPERPTFTTEKLSSLPELRETLEQWHEEFKDEGPHADDIGALERYLRRVILEERNMEKVVSIMRWLDWIIDQEAGNGVGGKAWRSALDGIYIKVQEAVSERGLGRLKI